MPARTGNTSRFSPDEINKSLFNFGQGPTSGSDVLANIQATQEQNGTYGSGIDGPSRRPSAGPATMRPLGGYRQPEQGGKVSPELSAVEQRRVGAPVVHHEVHVDIAGVLDGAAGPELPLEGSGVEVTPPADSHTPPSIDISRLG